MLNSFSSKAIMTKAKAMYGKRLTGAQYQELLHKKSVSQIASYLRDETAYASALKDIQPGSIHRGQLENMLRREHFNRYCKLVRYDNGSTLDSYYHYPTHEIEIGQILQMIRLLNTGNTEEFILQYPSFVDRNTNLRFMELAKVKNFDGLIEVLKGTPYSKLLLPLRPKSGEQIDYTRCEVALMTYHYEHLMTMILKSFHGKKAKQLEEIWATQIELRNIMNLYRIKRYFPATNQEILKAAIIPIHNRIPEGEMEQFIAAPDARTFIELIEQSAYAKYYGREDFEFIEYSTKSIRYHLNKRYLRFANDAYTAFTAYLVLSDMEVNNIVKIIEGVRYQASVQEIESLLVL